MDSRSDNDDSNPTPEHPVFGDWGPSVYNDGDGISCNVIFMPLPDPTKKKRKGGKAKTISKALGLHEDWELCDFLRWVVGRTLERFDMLNHSSLLDGRPVASNSFTVSYSVPNTHLQDIVLESERDYMTMMKQAKEKVKPKAKVMVTELAQPDKDAVQDSDNDNDCQKKKTKTHEPSPEEEEQDEVIQMLQGKYTCKDNLCKSTHCFITRLQATHVKLTFEHLHAWSAAIQGKVQGVNHDTPPHSRLFDVTTSKSNNKNTTDIALLSARCLDQTKCDTAAPATTSTQVVMNFKGLAEALAVCQPDLATWPTLSASSAANVQSKLPPKLPLDEFCHLYEISDSTYRKLREMEVDRPHLLRILKDKDLKTEGLILTSQIAAIRDAEEHWLADMKSFES
ncbi:hypothetical protein EV421DRAFT_1910864 [Armillaria borealis]|uniref:Uncharacterized protein n=1 Tax=Armillaria borealis TaxID=47425 RepID=A0AA39MFM5_9AGAR|nr:hypothetical protein EV421DRAFT_1910864 [Armillaria borealis]